MMHLTIPLTVENVIAIYAALVSTCSVILAMKVYRTGGPMVELDWGYYSDKRRLVIDIQNMGRHDITVTGFALYVIREEIFNKSITGRSFSLKRELLDEIPMSDWCGSRDLGEPPFRVRLFKRQVIWGCFGHAARLRRSMVSSS